MPTDFHSLFATLEARKLRYVVVGGLALVLHGVDRLTADIDLAVDLAPEAAGNLIATLLGTGYRPAAPVDARLFADPAMRTVWRRERGMQVFSLWDTTGARPTIDLFTEAVIPFEDLWNGAIAIEITQDLAIRVASIPHLIQLKEIAGRPQDLADIERLRLIVSRMRT
jgi:hypothetical protein